MHKLLLFLAVFSFNGFYSYPAHAATIPQTVDHVQIQRRRLVLVRGPKLVKDFPDRKTAIVVYPVISGLTDPAVLRRVRAILEFKNIFDYSLQEYREDSWLSEFGYEVNYNSNYLLDITFNQSGLAAYPDEQSKHFLINLKNGRVVKAVDAFESDNLNELVAMVDAELQQEIQTLGKEVTDPEEKQTLQDAYSNLKFEMKDLDDFSVGPKGITFLYDAGFPHVIKALEPQGRYFFPYAKLRRYIKREGPLGQFVY